MKESIRFLFDWRGISTEQLLACVLNAYRNPEEHKEFLDKLRANEDPEEDYSGSICPPPSN